MGARVMERVAVLGSGADAESWAELLAERVRVARDDTAGADLVLEFRGAEGDAVPSAVVSGPADHPLTRLVESLAQAKREWEEAFDAVVDPVAILDPEGVVTRANARLAAVVGRAVDAVVPCPYRELLGDAVGGADPVAETLRDGRPRTQEARFSRVPGVHLVTASPLRKGGLVATLKEVTELKEQQRLLEQASRLADVGQLAAGVAHEINTPLASIALRAESLLAAAADPGLAGLPAFRNFPRYLKTIDEEVYRCKKIIGALLEFSRSRKPEVRDADLNALAETAAELVRHPMRLKQVELKLDLDPALPDVRADDGQLRQVLLALLLNALDATAAGGHVRLATRGGPEAVALTVEDDGAGIPPELLDKVFTPFFTTKPVGRGTGLGLAICHGIVEAHGGEIRIESEPGRGTRVGVTLPRRPPAGRPAARGEGG
jgi:signal transduction histidine kinase